jgi:hypothetical protein
MSVHDIGKGYRWRVGQKQDWLIVVAFVCVVFVLASLTVLRFYPPDLPSVRIAGVLLWVASGIAMVVLLQWLRRSFVPDARWFLRSRSRTKAINKLYEELSLLRSRAVQDPRLKEQVDAKFTQLRQLQTEEAEEWALRSDAALLLTPDEARRALDRARELLARYENPSPSDSSSKP